MLVRDDLKSPAYQAVQASHAAIAASTDGLIDSTEHPNLVMLSVNDEEQLLRSSVELTNNGIHHRAFYEADIDGYSALATQPIKKQSPLRKLFGGYSLLK